MEREQIIEQGMRLLKDVHEDEHFRTVDGRILKSVRELVMLLETYRDEHFTHHVNEHRNDFAAWIEHSVKDGKLAERIRTVRTPQDIQQEIALRLEEIENDLLRFEKEPIREPQEPKPQSVKKPDRKPIEKPERLPDEKPNTDAVERDDLLEEIERSIAQARAQLEIERAQEVREPEDLSGEPEALEEEPIEEPAKPKAKKEESKKSDGFSLKDFFIGFGFGALIGAVLGAIIGLMIA